VLTEALTLGFTDLQFEALLTTARQSANRYDYALLAMLGLLGLRIFEGSSADIGDLGEEHGHRVLQACGKGTKVVLVPFHRRLARAIDRAIGARASRPILLNSHGVRMDRHAATRAPAATHGNAGVRINKPHLHMLRTPGGQEHHRADNARIWLPSMSRREFCGPSGRRSVVGGGSGK
jgi:integrase/recombinase XerD